MTRLHPTRPPATPVLGFALGLIGGAVGTLAMGLYWSAVDAAIGRDPRGETTGGGHDDDSISLVGRQHESGESSTAATGRHLFEAIAGDRPSSATESLLSDVVHYSYGTFQGGLYGAIRSRAGFPDAAAGAAFGMALWLLGDELGVPLLGLAEAPSAYPARQHVHRLGAHLTYGLTVAVATRGLAGIVGAISGGLGR